VRKTVWSIESIHKHKYAPLAIKSRGTVAYALSSHASPRASQRESVSETSILRPKKLDCLHYKDHTNPYLANREGRSSAEESGENSELHGKYFSFDRFLKLCHSRRTEGKDRHRRQVSSRFATTTSGHLHERRSILFAFFFHLRSDFSTESTEGYGAERHLGKDQLQDSVINFCRKIAKIPPQQRGFFCLWTICPRGRVLNYVRVCHHVK
jgi:hypothetical protein